MTSMHLQGFLGSVRLGFLTKHCPLKFEGLCLPIFFIFQFDVVVPQKSLQVSSNTGPYNAKNSRHEYINPLCLHISYFFQIDVVVPQKVLQASSNTGPYNAQHSRHEYVNPLAFVIGWHPSMIHYCMMHTLHLGVFHHVNGGCLLCLMSFDFFGTLIVFDLTLFLSNICMYIWTCLG